MPVFEVRVNRVVVTEYVDVAVRADNAEAAEKKALAEVANNRQHYFDSNFETMYEVDEPVSVVLTDIKIIE